jgi:hypothetical protein
VNAMRPQTSNTANMRSHAASQNALRSFNCIGNPRHPPPKTCCAVCLRHERGATADVARSASCWRGFLCAPSICLPHCLPQRVLFYPNSADNFKKPLRRRRKCNLSLNFVRSTPESGHSAAYLECPLKPNSGERACLTTAAVPTLVAGENFF